MDQHLEGGSGIAIRPPPPNAVLPSVIDVLSHEDALNQI